MTKKAPAGAIGAPASASPPPPGDQGAIRAQEGPQERFLSSPADIAIYGGAAGGGKTFALLLESIRHIEVPDFGAVVFRRESVQITNEGGLWDSAMGLYPMLGGAPVTSPKMRFDFPKGGRVTFAHLNLEKDVLGWQGAQIPLIAFDELTHFSRSQFFYMLSRNRSLTGVRPYVRATCNPDADSWVAEFISWWIDQETGYPIPERSGAVRWFVRINEQIEWADTMGELVIEFDVKPEDCKSVTFIAASVFDNQILLSKDPGYVGNLRALSRVERERLLGGNWKIKPAAGLYFQRSEATILDVAPTDITSRVRAWDFAATEPTEKDPSPDYTAGVLLGRRANGRVVVLDVIHLQRRAHNVRDLVLRTARADGPRTRIVIPQDPGQAGKDQAESYVALLSGYPAYTRRPSRDKVTRADPFAAQWQGGNVDVVRAPWNEEFFAELEGFPDGAHDDIVDASADAFAELPNATPIPGTMSLEAL